MTDEVVSEGGVDPEHGVGVELALLRSGVGEERLLDKLGNAVADQDEQEERLPLVVIVVVGLRRNLMWLWMLCWKIGWRGGGDREEGDGGGGGEENSGAK
ncbi:Ferric-chelate reductase 1 [Hordeum vulgare]|nr:Ferric-chelate reductase 1 [Hordeum vulgare]